MVWCACCALTQEVSSALSPRTAERLRGQGRIATWLWFDESRKRVLLVQQVCANVGVACGVCLVTMGARAGIVGKQCVPCACAVAELLCACVGVGLVAVKLGWVMANS